jgi:predicted SnoaL-like aldol condensation-catalyzing enzyme
MPNGPKDRAGLVRTVIEECWSGPAGLDRMAGLVTPGYMHHTPWGDQDFAGFRAGLDYVGTVFTSRRYKVVHLVDDGALVAALLTWTGVRQSDQSAVTGRGAYHCRLDGGRIAEDWDVFFPMS